MKRIFIFRAGLFWYLFVLLWPAVLSLVTTGISMALGNEPPDFTNPPFMKYYPMPDEAKQAGFLIWIPFVFIQQMLLSSPMGEEIGWRGYLLPRMQKRWNALYSGLWLGLMWGLWHLPKFFTKGDPLADTSFIWFLTGIMGVSVLFTWVYNNTRGSLFLALLFHTSISVTNLFLSATIYSPWISPTVQWSLIVLICVLPFFSKSHAQADS